MYYATTYIWKSGVPSYQHVWLPHMKITTPQVCRLSPGFKTSSPFSQDSKHHSTFILINFPSSQTSPTCGRFSQDYISYFILASNINQRKEKDKLLIILAQISCDATWLRRSTSKDKSRRLAPAFNRKGYRPQGNPKRPWVVFSRQQNFMRASDFIQEISHRTHRTDPVQPEYLIAQLQLP